MEQHRPRSPLQAFYEDAGTTVASGPERARRQLRMLSRIASEAGRPLRVVDVGCGDGRATALAAEAVRPGSVLGLDWSRAALRRACGHGITVAQAALDGVGLPVRSASADVVVMSEVIEHLVDPDTAVGEVRRVLSPGGTLLLSTPNLAAWYNRGLLLVGIQPVFSEVSLRGIFGRPGHDVVGHLRLFTRRALIGFLSAHGFVDIEIWGAEYHDVPRPLRPIDRLLTHWPGAASLLLARARTPG